MVGLLVGVSCPAETIIKEGSPPLTEDVVVVEVVGAVLFGGAGNPVA